MEECNPARTPMVTCLKLKKDGEGEGVPFSRFPFHVFQKLITCSNPLR